MIVDKHAEYFLSSLLGLVRLGFGVFVVVEALSLFWSNLVDLVKNRASLGSLGDNRPFKACLGSPESGLFLNNEYIKTREKFVY